VLAGEVDITEEPNTAPEVGTIAEFVIGIVPVGEAGVAVGEEAAVDPTDVDTGLAGVAAVVVAVTVAGCALFAQNPSNRLA
jgi:hypothetical protein